MMFLPFEVGKTYKMVTLPTSDSPGYNHHPGWCDEMAQYKGKIMVCASLDDLDDFVGALVPYDNQNTDEEFSYHRNWVVTCKPPVEYPTCICNIWVGCSCGAFVQEMQMKGRTFNPVLKMWVPNAV